MQTSTYTLYQICIVAGLTDFLLLFRMTTSKFHRLKLQFSGHKNETS